MLNLKNLKAELTKEHKYYMEHTPTEDVNKYYNLPDVGSVSVLKDKLRVLRTLERCGDIDSLCTLSGGNTIAWYVKEPIPYNKWMRSRIREYISKLHKYEITQSDIDDILAGKLSSTIKRNRLRNEYREIQ